LASQTGAIRYEMLKIYDTKPIYDTIVYI